MTRKSATREGVLEAASTKRSTHRSIGADWESIESHYRAGVLSVRQIAAIEGVSEAAIRKKAKAAGWARDLTERVQQAVREKLIAEPVEEAEVRERQAVRAEQREQREQARRADPLPAEDIVDAASETVVRVVREHRKTIKQSRELLETMLAQLTEAVTEREVLELEIEQATDEDENPKRRNRYLKAVSLPTHVTALRDLSLTLRNLVALEREAFGVGDAAPPPVAEVSAIEQSRAGFADLRAAFIKRLAQTVPATPA
jgi:hypothetical protein